MAKFRYICCINYRFVFLFLAGLLCRISVYSQTEVLAFTENSIEQIKENNQIIRGVILEAQAFFTQKMGHWVDISETDYLLLGDSVLVNPDGTHYLYSYHPQRKTFLRLDKSEFHGHHFGRRLFLYEGNIYAIGGYGFWASHSKLIRFNWISREWDLVPIVGPLPKTAPGTTVILGDTLFMYGLRDLGSSDYTKDKEINQLVYFINLSTYKSEVRKAKHPVLETPHTQSLNDQRSTYSIFGNLGSVERIFDKSTGILYHSISGPSLYNGIEKKYHSFRDSILSFVVKNQIYVLDRLGNERIISIPEYIKLYCTAEFNMRDVGHLEEAIEESSNGNQRNLIWILISITVASWIGLGVYILAGRKRKSQKLQKYYELLDKTEVDYRVVRRLTDGDYSEKEIDLLLKIEHLPKMIKNVKRSKLLFEINEQFPGYIVKVPDMSKKSMFIYRIQKL